MTRELLRQYKDLQEEIKKINAEIEKTEEEIEKLHEEGTVVDKVKGGEGGWQGFKIEGFPIKEYEKRKNILKRKINMLISKENELLETSVEIESFIETIENSRDRRILRLLVFEKKSQQQISEELYIDRSLVSKILCKYL